MNIVITAFEAIPDSGTEAGLAEKWAKAYLNLGHSVTVVTQKSKQDGSFKKWEQSGINLIQLGIARDTAAASKISKFIYSGFVYSRWRAEVIRNSKKLFSGADLVQHVSWGSARLIPPFPRKWKSSTSWVWGPLGGGQLPIFRGVKLSNYPLEILRTLSFAVGFFGVSKFFKRTSIKVNTLSTNNESARFLRLCGVTSIHTMSADGIESSEILTSPKHIHAGRVDLVWAGRLVGTKRADIAIYLVSRLIKLGLPATLSILGSGPEAQKLNELIRKLNLGSNVRLEGKVPWRQVGNYLRSSDFLIFTSMRDSSAPAVLEAASNATPTLCLRVQGVGTIVPSNVAIGPVKFTNTERLVNDLANLCVSYYEDSEKYFNASIQALNFAKSNTWELKAKTVLELIAL